MNAQLLLLLALAGPFCAFTRASPTTMPPVPEVLAIQTEEATIFPTTESPKGYTVTTSLPPMEPVPVPQELTTEAVTERVHQQLTTEATTDRVPQELTVTERVNQELTTEATTERVNQELTTEAVTERVNQELTTEAVTERVNQELTTEAVTESIQQELTTEATTLAAVVTEHTTRIFYTTPETESNSGVVFEGEAVAEDLTSGQSAGIAIGVLLAIAFVIAVAIAAAKRMGKYSP